MIISDSKPPKSASHGHAAMYTPARMRMWPFHVTGSIRIYRARTEDAKLFRTMASPIPTLPGLVLVGWILGVRVKGLGLRVEDLEFRV